MSLKMAFLASAGLVGLVVALPGLLILLLIVASTPLPPPASAGNSGNTGGIPPVALQAYSTASQQVSALVPGCTVPPWALMGVGKVESNHAAGRAISPSGEVSPPIVGPALDGSLAATAIIHDTDGGALDGDPVWDHALGPMQILPSMWRAWGHDGNADGQADPQDIFDAALSAAVILCQPPADLSQVPSLAAALHRYNPSDAYVATVLSWAAAYRHLGSPGPAGADAVTGTPEG